MMRRLILGMVIGAVGLLGTATAHAGALTGGTFSLTIGGLPPLTFTGAATAAGSAINSQSVTLMAGPAFAGMTTVKLTAKQAPPLSKIVLNITTNEAIKATGDPLFGDSKVGAIKGVALQKGFGGVTIIAVPIAAGISGTENVKGTIAVKAVSKKWTSGTTTVTGLPMTTMGATTFMAMGTVMVGTPGAITLVAVSKITVTGATNLVTYSLAKLEMDFASVPEPTMPLMMVAGAATLALVGGRKLRRS